AMAVAAALRTPESQARCDHGTPMTVLGNRLLSGMEKPGEISHAFQENRLFVLYITHVCHAGLFLAEFRRDLWCTGVAASHRHLLQSIRGGYLAQPGAVYFQLHRRVYLEKNC